MRLENSYMAAASGDERGQQGNLSLGGSPLGSLHPREGWKHQSEGLIASYGAAQESLVISTFPWLVRVGEHHLSLLKPKQRHSFSWAQELVLLSQQRRNQKSAPWHPSSFDY